MSSYMFTKTFRRRRGCRLWSRRRCYRSWRYASRWLDGISVRRSAWSGSRPSSGNHPRTWWRGSDRWDSILGPQAAPLLLLPVDKRKYCKDFYLITTSVLYVLVFRRIALVKYITVLVKRISEQICREMSTKFLNRKFFNPHPQLHLFRITINFHRLYVKRKPVSRRFLMSYLNGSASIHTR